jgi:heat-inducible transcriptional repressor
VDPTNPTNPRKSRALGRSEQRSEVGLDARHAEVLREIVRHHIQTGEPIGSATVSRAVKLGLSAASIRHVMAELEELGLLTQPHTSAGRVPTERAYRVYVDQMVHRPRMAAGQAAAIERALVESRGEIEELLGEASRQLSFFSHQVGLVLAPELRRLIVDQLEFVRLDARRVMAILVARSGVVHDRILDVSEPLEPQELERIGRHLTDELGGHTLPEMREILERRLREERAVYDRLMARSLELGRRALELQESEAELFVEGASNLLSPPEFSDLDLLRAVFRTLEDKRTLIDLLGRLLDSPGVRVVIGEENPLSELARCSLVASPYRAGERVMGTVGIVGPIRMPYGRAMALVDHLSRVLTRLLSPVD